MSKTAREPAEILIDVCHRLYARGFVTATDGNVSVRLTNGNFLTTRTSVNKGMVTHDDVVEVDIHGHSLASTPSPLAAHGSSLSAPRPSTELGMHLYIYSQRPDVNAVVHAHPTYATGFATAGIALDRCVSPEVIVGLGAIPLAQYATPSTEEVAISLSPFVKKADAILLSNHGVVTYGHDLFDAYFKMEKVEHTAHITFVARMLGGEKTLNTAEIEKLRSISLSSYGKDFSDKPACDTAATSSNDIPTDEELRSIVRQMIHKP